MPIIDTTDFELEDLGEVPGEELLKSASTVAEQMLTGEIPADVVSQIEIMSAEKGLNAGLGQGQNQRNLTARDLGMTSFDVQSRGTALATGIADTSAKYTQLREQRYEFNRELLSDMKATDLKEDALALSAHQLIAQNDQFILGLTNDLIISNSRMGIAGVQGNIDTLLGSDTDAAFFDAQNAELLSLIDKYVA